MACITLYGYWLAYIITVKNRCLRQELLDCVHCKGELWECCLLVGTAKSGNQEVACYHFHPFQILHKLVHCALPHIRCWTSTKWRPVPSLPPKWCVKRGFVTGLYVKTFLPETIFGIYNGELLCLWKSGHNFLHLWAFALDGKLCSNCECHICNLLFLTTTNVLETHSVGSVTGVMASQATISSSFSLIWFHKATCTVAWRGGCSTGGTASSVTMLLTWEVPQALKNIFVFI